MKSKKGFTLIELLAIIVILAIIAVITVPIILNIIENSKKGAATDSAYGYKDAVNKWYIEKLSRDHNFNLNSSYTITNGNLGNETISVSGDKPTSGYLNYTNNVLTTGCLVFGDYAVTFTNGEVTSTVKGNCNETTEITCGADEYMDQEYVVTDTEACMTFLTTSMGVTNEMSTSLCNGGKIEIGGTGVTLNQLIGGELPYSYVEDFVELQDVGYCKPISEQCYMFSDNGDGTATVLLYKCAIEIDAETQQIVPAENPILNPNIPSKATTADGELTVTTIADGAFNNMGITSVTIPNTVTTIGQDSFGQNSLTSIELPSSITTIGSNAFNNNNITSIEIPNGVTTIGSSAFARNNLETVVLPESVTTIGNYAFKKQKDVPQQPDSNTNLTTIYNNTGREFNWNQVTSASMTSDYTFETGTITHSAGNITVTTGYPSQN